MRIVLTIIILVNLTPTLFAQSTDTTKRDTIILSTSIPPILSMLDSLGIHFSNSHSQNIIPSVPTCSCLKLKNGKYYLENDTIPYHGTCVVTNMNAPGNLAVIGNDYFVDIKIKNILCFYPDYIKIISRYTDGKRNGNREYFDKTGKLYKTESYLNGVLVKTTYP